MTDRIRVGIIGLNPDRNWAAMAHVPALQALESRFRIVGVANSSAASARRSAEASVFPKPSPMPTHWLPPARSIWSW